MPILTIIKSNTIDSEAHKELLEELARLKDSKVRLINTIHPSNMPYSFFLNWQQFPDMKENLRTENCLSEEGTMTSLIRSFLKFYAATKEELQIRFLKVENNHPFGDKVYNALQNVLREKATKDIAIQLTPLSWNKETPLRDILLPQKQAAVTTNLPPLLSQPR